MTKEEFKKIRTSMAMTQADFGLWLGYAKNSARIRVYEIESGKLKIPANKELFLIKNAPSPVPAYKFQEQPLLP
jgi:DNA-binding transcriptional regulator YiaG